MKDIKSILFSVVLLVCCISAGAQGVRLYKSNGTTLDIKDAEMDSIVTVPGEETDRVYRSDGTVFKILYSELDSIVGFAGHDTDQNFVDLGLSVRWASRNIGAARPEDYGDYYAWGEISLKDSYTKENSKMIGVSTGIISGNPEYDAARAVWGAPARIPTSEEFFELCDKCLWEWTTVNGTDGQLVTGPNGNSIFLPAAGIRRGNDTENAGEKGCYWSSSPYEEDDASAYNYLFNGSGYWGSWRSRSDGLTIRAVSGDIRCIPYTGDTLRVGELSADISVMFSFVPKEGITGGIEYSSSTSGKHKKTMDVNKDGEYVMTLDGLERGTKYKYRSFVIVGGKNIYGETEQFITKNYDDNLTKGEWIDLGLSVKWASHNVGAEKPEDYGNYFAWGEIYPKSSYDEENCTTTHKKMNDISGDSEYDAACASWGGSARIPTDSEFKELCEKCDWKWTPRNGVNGMLVTGPNGNSIFIPAAGFRVGPALDYEEGNGFYWSSTPSDEQNDRSYSMSFSKGGSRVSLIYRHHGRSVRPVSD